MVHKILSDAEVRGLESAVVPLVVGQVYVSVVGSHFKVKELSAKGQNGAGVWLSGGRMGERGSQPYQALRVYRQPKKVMEWV